MKPTIRPFLAQSKGRKPQNENKVRPSELIVLKLRDRVSQKDIGAKNVECLHELTMAITCLKTYSFNEMSCEKEIKSMQKCFSDLAEAGKKQETVGKKISPKVSQRLLNRYPNI